MVIAVILFVIWLLFHATGALVNLLWIASSYSPSSGS
jgi:hypothetical protein